MVIPAPASAAAEKTRQNKSSSERRSEEHPGPCLKMLLPVQSGNCFRFQFMDVGAKLALLLFEMNFYLVPGLSHERFSLALWTEGLI